MRIRKDPVVLGQWGEIGKVRMDKKAETGLRTPLKIVYFLRDMVIMLWDKRVMLEGSPLLSLQTYVLF